MTEWATLYQDSKMTVRATERIGHVATKIEYAGVDDAGSLYYNFPNCSIRYVRDEQRFVIGGPRAPERDWFLKYRPSDGEE